MAAIKASILRNWAPWLCAGAAFGFIAFVVVGSAYAADKNGLAIGGDCCSDLESRIAELEATTARKSNRKVSLTIYGQVSETLQYFSAPGFTHTQVQSNANRDQDTFVGFAGQAKIGPDATAGFALEIEAGNFVNGAANPLAGGNDTNGMGTRQAFVYIKSATIGGVAIGLQNDATYGITDLTGQAQDDLASTNVAHTKLSFRPIVGSGFLAFLADPWDGVRNDSLKYVSPEWAGFSLSASWGDAINVNATGSGAAQGNIWDVAVRFNKDVGAFRTQAALGYRDGTAIQDFMAFGGLGGLAIQDVKVLSGSAGVMHMPTGVFLNGSYGNIDLSSLFSGAPNNISAWEIQGGVEEKWTALGHTTIFAEYGQDRLTGLGLGTPTVYGLGVVQGIDPAAMSLFISWQEWTQANSLVGGNISTVEAGAKVKF